MTAGRAVARLVDALTGCVQAWDRPPAIPDGDRADLYLLARHFHIAPEDAWNVRPAWAMDLLLEGLTAEGGDTDGIA